MNEKVTIAGLTTTWWRLNLCACIYWPEWKEWQRTRHGEEIIPVLRWLFLGAVHGQA